MIDICVTELIKNTDFLKSNFAARKWSEVVELEYFDKVRNLAQTAFEYMDAHEHFVPEVTRHGLDGIALTWTTEEERIVTIVLEPSKFSYRWGRCGINLPTYTHSIQKMLDMMDLFSKYLNRTIEVNHESNDVYSVSIGANLLKPAKQDRSRDVK